MGHIFRAAASALCALLLACTFPAAGHGGDAIAELAAMGYTSEFIAAMSPDERALAIFQPKFFDAFERTRGLWKRGRTIRWVNMDGGYSELTIYYAKGCVVYAALDARDGTEIPMYFRSAKPNGIVDGLRGGMSRQEVVELFGAQPTYAGEDRLIYSGTLSGGDGLDTVSLHFADDRLDGFEIENVWLGMSLADGAPEELNSTLKAYDADAPDVFAQAAAPSPPAQPPAAPSPEQEQASAPERASPPDAAIMILDRDLAMLAIGAALGAATALTAAALVALAASARRRRAPAPAAPMPAQDEPKLAPTAPVPAPDETKRVPAALLSAPGPKRAPTAPLPAPSAGKLAPAATRPAPDETKASPDASRSFPAALPRPEAPSPRAETPVRRYRCPKCKTELPPRAERCPGCGAKMKQIA